MRTCPAITCPCCYERKRIEEEREQKRRAFSTSEEEYLKIPEDVLVRLAMACEKYPELERDLFYVVDMHRRAVGHTVWQREIIDDKFEPTGTIIEGIKAAVGVTSILLVEGEIKRLQEAAKKGTKRK